MSAIISCSCGTEFQPRQRNQRFCSKLCYVTAWRAANPDKVRQYHARNGRRHGQRYRLRRKFQITPEQYDDMLERQGGVCGICGKAPSPDRRLAVDHDHETGRIRGLLCGVCNTALGKLEKHREEIRVYLERDYLV